MESVQASHPRTTACASCWWPLGTQTNFDLTAPHAQDCKPPMSIAREPRNSRRRRQEKKNLDPVQGHDRRSRVSLGFQYSAAPPELVTQPTKNYHRQQVGEIVFRLCDGQTEELPRRRRPLSQNGKKHAARVRLMGACESCRSGKRKVRHEP